MNKHLKLVREFHSAFSYHQAEHGTNARLSDMDIIVRQSLLMDEGSTVLHALESGEMVEILAGFINLAYCALGAIAMKGDNVIEHDIAWQHDGFVLSLMRLLSDKINDCTSGNTENYSEVYSLCVHLSRSFLNADFDKALQMVHDNNMAKLAKTGHSIYDDAEARQNLKRHAAADLSECLYE